MTDHASRTSALATPDRREAMLLELVAVMRRTHRRRRIRRGLLTAGGMSATVLVLVLTLPRPETGISPPATIVRISEDIDFSDLTGERRSPGCETGVVRDASAVDRFRAEPAGIAVRLDDDALLETLAAIHRPAGLIRFGDRVALSAAVVDPDRPQDR